MVITKMHIEGILHVKLIIINTVLRLSSDILVVERRMKSRFTIGDSDTSGRKKKKIRICRDRD